MTKAHALRNYFKQVYDVDNLTGMSELAVWKQFLKNNSNFDSLASTMTGLYTEMADNEISLGGGSGDVYKVILDHTMMADEIEAGTMQNPDGYGSTILFKNTIPQGIEDGDVIYCIFTLPTGGSMVLSGIVYGDGTEIAFSDGMEGHIIRNLGFELFYEEAIYLPLETEEEAISIAENAADGYRQMSPRVVIFKGPRIDMMEPPETDPEPSETDPEPSGTEPIK